MTFSGRCRREEGAPFGRADCGGPETGGTGDAGGGAEPGQGDSAERRLKTLARPALTKTAADYIASHYGLNKRRSCRLAKQTRSMQYYRSVKDPRSDLRARMRDIAGARVRYGYRRIHVLLRRDGWKVGKSQMYRLYQEEQLQRRSKLPKRRKMVVTRRERFRPRSANGVWSLDFVSDQLSDGTRFRALTAVDLLSREALAIEVGQRLRGEHVVSALNRLSAQRGVPKYQFVDNGSEFSRQLLDLWAYHSKARIVFSRPGKPTENCYVETFNGSPHDECLNVHRLESMDDAKAIVEDWRGDYNETRPRMALNDASPEECARSSGNLRAETWRSNWPENPTRTGGAVSKS